METATIQAILGVGGIFAGFFTLIKYIIKNQREVAIDLSKSNKEIAKDQVDAMARNTQLLYDYVEKKNGHLERISADFTKSIERVTVGIEKSNKEVARKLSTMARNDAAIGEALRINSETLRTSGETMQKAIKVIELKERKEI